MDALTELWESIKLGLSERLTSPLMGTYIVSWLICNYRIVLIIVGTGAVDKKLGLLDRQIYEFWWQVPYVFLFPLALTLFYIFFYPKIAKPVYERRLKNIRDLTEIRRKIDNETPMSEEVGRRLRLDYYEQQEKFKTERARYEQTISDLRTELESVRTKPTQIASSPRAPQSPNEAPANLRNVIMCLVALAIGDSKVVSKQKLIADVKSLLPELTAIRIESAFDQLQNDNMLVPANQGNLFVTEKGAAYIVNNDLDKKEVGNRIIIQYRKEQNIVRDS